MKELIELIKGDECRGAIRCADGSVHKFTHRGVVDLFKLVVESGVSLRGAVAADRVIGRGAALLMIKGGVSRGHAFMMSKSARQVLHAAGVDCSCDQEVEHIANRDGTDICPVEKATVNTVDPDEAAEKIRHFLTVAGIL